jgi:hypothetical protein
MSNKESNNSRVTLPGRALKVPEPYAVKIACTVLWGRKLPGCKIINHTNSKIINEKVSFFNYYVCDNRK